MNFQIGCAIFTYRKEFKLDTKNLCNCLGISQPTLSRIESGSTSLTLEQFIVFCDFVGIKPIQFLKRVVITQPKTTVKL